MTGDWDSAATRRRRPSLGVVLIVGLPLAGALVGGAIGYLTYGPAEVGTPGLGISYEFELFTRRQEAAMMAGLGLLVGLLLLGLVRLAGPDLFRRH